MVTPLPFQIISRLTLLTSSLTTRLIQNNYANIVKFKSFLKTCIDKASHNKKNDILHKFFNKTSSQTWGKKVKRPILSNGGSSSQT